MPGIVRLGDAHVGHASPTPNPFHQTTYAVGSPKTFVNGKAGVRKGDTTGCGDPAVGHSPTVYMDGIPVHRLGDSTGGHGSWVPNASAQSSTDVFADHGGKAPLPQKPYDPANGITSNSRYVEQDEEGNIIKSGCDSYNWNTGTCQD